MDHAPAEVEPKTPWWLTVVGVFLLLGVVVYALTSDSAPDGAAKGASSAAHS